MGTSLLFVNFNEKGPGICDTDKYFSDYTKMCERAVLQLGHDEEIRSLDLDDLYNEFPTEEILVPDNPAYIGKKTGTKDRRYKGVSLKAVVESLIPKGERLEDHVIAITCLDGFDPILDSSIIEKLDEYKAIIATEELTLDREGADISKDGKWELLHLSWGIVSPGPFYIVWDNLEGTYWKGWPLQVKSLRLVKKDKFEATLAKLQPAEEFLGQKPPSNVEEGFNQFKGKCLTCHSIHGIGGKKANIDLIDRIRLFRGSDSLPYLNAIIRNPPAGMKDILDIKMSDEDIKNINSYLKVQAKN